MNRHRFRATVASGSMFTTNGCKRLVKDQRESFMHETKAQSTYLLGQCNLRLIRSRRAVGRSPFAAKSLQAKPGGYWTKMPLYSDYFEQNIHSCYFRNLPFIKKFINLNSGQFEPGEIAKVFGNNRVPQRGGIASCMGPADVTPKLRVTTTTLYKLGLWKELQGLPNMPGAVLAHVAI